MRINHNIASLNTYRQLTMNNTNSTKSLEKLSSGYRINRAGDDAAGLAISEKMRGQIRGLDQASRNSQDAISLIQTAEGALNETHSILQRMRELAVQAANDTNTEDDRGEIQKEINQLTSEINRIGNTTEFNTMKLLNGDRAIVTTQAASTEEITKVIDEGTGGNITLTRSLGITISGSEEAWQKAIANGIEIGTDPSANEAIDWKDIDLNEAATVTLDKAANGDLKITIVATGSTTPNEYNYETTITADAMKAAAVNGVYSAQFHGVSFDLDVAEFEKAGASNLELDFQAAFAATDTDVTGTFALKNDYDSGAAQFNTFTIDGTNAALAGVAYLEIELDNGNNQIIIKGYAANKTDVLLNDVITPDTLPGTAGDKFAYEENGISFEFELVAQPDGTDITAFKTNLIDISGLAASLKDETTTVPGAITVVSDKSLIMQIGANTGQSMAIDISDMRSKALGISSDTAGATKTVKDSMGLDATAKYTAIANVTKGTDNEAIEYALDVSTSANASAAIKVLDESIAAVSSERSKLGAIQNRLEHTINNLGTSSENLTAAESRIRDVDMAKEMMEFTKNNILTQAAQAMLAQANQQPQGVLQLLR
ncbi:MAG TPA: flagellin [Pseudobacteroides sp.]|nr:flagellin [Pseudobacteroides sp.]